MLAQHNLNIKVQYSSPMLAMKNQPKDLSAIAMQNNDARTRIIRMDPLNKKYCFMPIPP